MSFLDELDQRPRAADRSAARARDRASGGRPQTQAAARRRVVLGGAVAALVIAVALAIGGLRDSSRVNGFRNYSHAVQHLVRESNREGAALIAALSSGSSLGAVQVESQANGLADDSAALLRQGRGTAHPAELAAAQSDLVEVLGFRRDAIAAVAKQLPAALGDSGSGEATAGIAAAMQNLLASDVILWKRVGPELRAGLQRQGLSAPSGLVHGRSLSDTGWVSPTYAATRITALRASPTSSGATSSGSTSSGSTPGTSGAG